jgi:hypothetical protein
VHKSWDHVRVQKVVIAEKAFVNGRLMMIGEAASTYSPSPKTLVGIAAVKWQPYCSWYALPEQKR